ncbi:MAG: hypothetical protein GKR90_24145 [Pseudomonadales bacterium]|nr:hypothetical protein [Pseudomonadales bacterium]
MNYGFLSRLETIVMANVTRKKCSVADIVERTGIEINSVRTICWRLVRMGLLEHEQIAAERVYSQYRVTEIGKKFNRTSVNVLENAKLISAD